MLKQLNQLDRVLEIKGPLMLNVLHDEIYKLRRYREEEYGHSPTVDCFSSRSNKALMREVMFDFYFNKYGLNCNLVPNFQKQDSFYPPFDLYHITSSSTLFSVFERRDEHYSILWFIDIANTTPGWEIIQPNRHLAIVGFNGFGFTD